MSEAVRPISQEAISTERAPARDGSVLAAWQIRLLPLMQGTLIGLTIFFFLASGTQLLYLQQRIGQVPRVDVDGLRPEIQSASQASHQERMDLLWLRATIALEANTLERRHHHANVVLMSLLWIRYLGIVTGMILSIVGAVFILGKLQERFSELSAHAGGAEGTLKSSSPGLILVVLGSVMVLATILDRRDMVVTDRPIYMEVSPAPRSGTDSGSPHLPPRTPTEP